jgi:hypothetical protein
VGRFEIDMDERMGRMENQVNEPKPKPLPLEFLNAAKCKRYALRCCEQRHHKFTRVSREFLEGVNDAVRIMIANKVSSAPSKGKTL